MYAAAVVAGLYDTTLSSNPSFSAVSTPLGGFGPRAALGAPWKTTNDVEFATPKWGKWFNNRRLPGSLGNIPPAEKVTAFCHLESPAKVA